MKTSAVLIAMILVGTTTSGALKAQGRGNGHANKPQTPAHITGKPASTPAAPKGHPSNPKGNGAGNPHTSGTTATATTATTTTTIVTTTTPTTVKNSHLEQRLQALLPGLNVSDASRGFKNWGQFVAAAHVSRNLNIPFTSLKARMTGTPPMSLGQAIQALKPTPTPTPTTITTSTVQTEVRRAEAEADEDFRIARDDRRR